MILACMKPTVLQWRFWNIKKSGGGSHQLINTVDKSDIMIHTLFLKLHYWRFLLRKEFHMSWDARKPITLIFLKLFNELFQLSEDGERVDHKNKQSFFHLP